MSNIVAFATYACLAAACTAQQPADVQIADAPSLAENAMVFEDCSVLTMTSHVALPQHSVVLADQKIVTIAPTSALAVPADTPRIDCAGRFLLPGLTDTHVHIGDSTELLSFLRYGVTTVINLGGDHLDLFSGERGDILRLRASVLSGEIPGPNILTSGQALDGDPPTGPFQRAVKDAAQARAAVLEQYQAGYDLIKVYDSLPPEVHEEIVAAADEVGLSVWGHVPEALGVRGTLLSGQRVIVHAEEFYPRFAGLQTSTVWLQL